MTKKEVLRSVDSLIRDLDEWTTKRVKASLDKDEKAYQEAMFQLEGLVADSQQELTYLRDYVDENVNEQLRIKQKTLYDHIRGHQYDQEIALNFDSRNVFLSPELVNANRETLRREKQQVHQRKRQERDLSYIDERITALAHDDTRQVSETMYKARNKVDNRSNIQRIDPFRGRSGTNIMAANIM